MTRKNLTNGVRNLESYPYIERQINTEPLNASSKFEYWFQWKLKNLNILILYLFVSFVYIIFLWIRLYLYKYLHLLLYVFTGLLSITLIYTYTHKDTHDYEQKLFLKLFMQLVKMYIILYVNIHFFRCIFGLKEIIAYKWECDLESSKCLDLPSQNVGWEIVEEHKFLQRYQM